MLRVSCLFILLVISGATTAADMPACSAPGYRQLDFWLGDWDSYDDAGKGPIDARDRVTAMLGGCVVHEVYDQNDGLKGESFSIYDQGRGVWHQTWMSSVGGLIVVEGSFKEGVLTLEGTAMGKDGKRNLIKVMRKAQDDGVRESARISKDGGKTWSDYFDIIFKTHKG